MAGNQSDARRRAEQAYRDAKASGADKRTQAQLFAEYEAWRLYTSDAADDKAR